MEKGKKLKLEPEVQARINVIPSGTGIEEENHEDLPVINIVFDPNDPANINGLNANVPLFIKKLWKIVNDEDNENIIAWNENGDAFEIHDQLQFMSETLPKYFKHNQLSSFVRQLNLYDFHKIQPLENSACQFSHPFFLKDVPQLLPLIKRKIAGRQRPSPASAKVKKSPEQSSPSSLVEELLAAVKDMKAKSDVITSDMTKLRQENAALWGEINSLRVKYSKQTKIINKLIHFLIAYMQKHHNTRKSGRTVSAANSNKFLKTGPKIMELDYRYKNNPHEFWTDFDSQQLLENSDNVGYTVVEPSESHNETDNFASRITFDSAGQQAPSTIEEVQSNSSPYHPDLTSPAGRVSPELDYSNSLPSSSKGSSSALQRSNSSLDNMGILIDNPRLEISGLKELFRNLTSDDMTNFYKLVNDNYKDQDDDLVSESENELVLLNNLSEFDSCNAEPDGDALNEKQAVILPSVTPTPPVINSSDGKQAANRTLMSSFSFENGLDKFNQLDTPALPFDDIIQLGGNIEDNGSFTLSNDDLLNSEEDLNNVAVDQFFKIN